MPLKAVNVAVGVVLHADKVFVCQRPKTAHQGGLWEFPGGKIEANETEAQALSRELQEEIGIHVQQSSPLITINHDYTDKKVTLFVRCVTEFTGEPHGKEGQPSEWRTINSLQPTDFPAANVAIIEALKKR